MTTMILAQPIHTFMFAVYIPLFALSHNLGMIPVEDAYRSFVVGPVLAILLIAFFWIFFRDKNRAALAATATFGLTWSFSRLQSTVSLQVVDLQIHPWLLAFAIYCLSMIVVICLVWRTKKVSSSTNIILNVAVFAMLSVSGYGVVPTVVGELGKARDGSSSPVLPNLGPSTQVARLPNIFHVVVDSYAREDVLRELYGYDNSSFTGALRGLGFFVADRATSPYGQTLQTMNAVFSMNYLEEIKANYGASFPEAGAEQTRNWLIDRLRRPAVFEALRSFGYGLAAVEGIYRPVRPQSPDYLITEEVAGIALNSFELLLLQSTPFHQAFLELSTIGNPHLTLTARNIIFALTYRDFDALRSPFIVYNHVLAPHPPFDLNGDGTPHFSVKMTINDGDYWFGGDLNLREDYRLGYIEKLRYTNSELLDMARAIIHETPDPKIIIFHGDHGGGLFFHTDDPNRTCMKERFSTLLAIYASDPNVMEALSHDMNVVNIYRIIFNEVFGAKLASLPSRNFFSPWNNPILSQGLSQPEIDTLGPSCFD